MPPSGLREIRPMWLDQEDRLRIAQTVGELLAAHGLLAGADMDLMVETVAEVAESGDDGYQLGRKIEDAIGWQCCFPAAKLLNEWKVLYRAKLRNNQGHWLLRAKVTAAFRPGDRIAWDHPERYGVVTKESPFDVASYIVQQDGDPLAGHPTNRRVIVGFENARPAS